MSIAGFIFALMGAWLSVILSLNRKTWLPTLLFFYHLGFACFYWYYVGDSSDALSYYESVRNVFKPGTEFVGWLAGHLRDGLSATYLDLFMLFHIAGFVGIVLLFDLCRSFLEASPVTRRLVMTTLFLPGLHFWTSAIGKDAIAFLGIMTVLVHANRAARLSIGVVCGLLVTGMVRPHMAVLLGASLALSLIFGARTSLSVRVSSVLGIVVAVAAAAPFVAEFVGLQDMNVDAMEEYVLRRQDMSTEGGSSIDIGSYPFPLQFFTFMFRPLFFDAQGLLGLFVSIENAIYLGLMIWTLPRVWSIFWNMSSSAFLRMNLIFWLLSVSILGSTIGNLGLIIRQKTMVVPSFMFFVLSALVTLRETQAKKRSLGLGGPATTPLAARAEAMSPPGRALPHVRNLGS